MEPQTKWWIPRSLNNQLLKSLNIFLVKKETIRTVLIATHLLTNNSRNNLELSLLCRNHSTMSLLTKSRVTVVQLSDVVCATLNNPDFISSIIPTIAEKVIQLMQPKIEQMVKDAIQPHLQPLLDKQVILEETVSQLQNNNANLKAKIDLIDMRLEEQEQYSRRTSLRFHNVRVPTDQKGNIIQPVDTDGIILKICNKHLTVPLDIHHIGRSHPIGEAKDGKISIIVRFLTYRQRHMVFSNKRKLKGNKDKMFIAENLTKYRYDLLRQLNGMKKINKVHSFWTHDGSILVKGKGELQSQSD